MSKIHVLTADITGNYQVAIHTQTPSGNNSAGISWKVSGLNSNLIGITILTEGTGAGQITTAEKATIVSGDVIEIIANIPAEFGGATSSSLNEMANNVINEYITKLSKQLKYFGYTQN